MIPQRIQEALDAAGIDYCLIGAHALAVHGVARFTADVDLLTMSAMVLQAGFWPAELGASVRRGDSDDPLAGLVRFERSALDLVVGRGPVMARALAEARHEPVVGCPVVSPLWLAMLKLEAGGVQDLADVQLLFDARRRAGHDLRGEVATHASELSDWGRRSWARIPAEP